MAVRLLHFGAAHWYLAFKLSTMVITVTFVDLCGGSPPAEELQCLTDLSTGILRERWPCLQMLQQPSGHRLFLMRSFLVYRHEAIQWRQAT
jgi:hypothetical protein